MDESTARARLGVERRATVARIEEMTVAFEGIIESTVDTNIDDEHDPEGATVAFERAQLAALLTQARAYLDELDRAVARVAAGSYSVCDRCGGLIASERLAARPAAHTCFRCAASLGPT